MTKSCQKRALCIQLDTTEATKHAMQKFEKHHNSIKNLYFQKSNNSNNDGKLNSATQQNFLKFLNFLVTRAYKHGFCKTNKMYFDGIMIGPDEATSLAQIFSKLHSPSIRLVFSCQVSEHGFEYMMSHYANKEKKMIHVYGRKQKQKNGISITGHGIKCSHVKCLSQQILSSFIGYLFLDGTSIGDSGIIALAYALWQNTTITNLRLSRNKFGSLGVQAIGNMLNQNSRLNFLDISYNNIGNDGIVALAKSLKVNSSLNVLDLTSVGCDNGCILALAENLAQNHGLKHLYLSGNGFDNNDTEDMIALGYALKQNFKLEELRLDNVLSQSDNEQLIGAFVNALDGKTTRLKVRMSRNVRSEFDNDAFDLLVQCNAPLLSLTLAQNKLQPHHFNAIAQGIRQQSFNVESLNLDYNRADDESIINLFNALVERNPTCALTGLSLKISRRITNVGAQHIIDKLPLTNLQCLSLNNIPIYDINIQQIALSLNDTKLTKLELFNIEIQDSGLIALSGSLKSNTKLRSLSLHSCKDITVLGKQDLFDTLKKYNMTLFDLNMQGCREYNIIDNSIKFYIQLNKVIKREKLCDCGCIPTNLFPFVLGKDNICSSIVFWVLHNFPHLYFHSGY